MTICVSNISIAVARLIDACCEEDTKAIAYIISPCRGLVRLLGGVIPAGKNSYVVPGQGAPHAGI